MKKNNRIIISTGTIVKIDIEKDLIEVSDASGQIVNYIVSPLNLFDTDGNRIFIDELYLGDQVLINETEYMVIMKVLRTA